LANLFGQMAEAQQGPRLLAARSEFGYTDRVDRALQEEPEAVPPDYQREITRRAALDAKARARADYYDRRRRIAQELAAISRQSYARGLGSDVRLVERQLAKLDKTMAHVLANLAP
jgi:hypothetical protein